MTVNITINKDNTKWDNHNKIFTVKKDNSGGEISKMNDYFYLENGNYTLYADGETTGKTFTVSGTTQSNVMVNYYTVTYNLNN